MDRAPSAASAIVLVAIALLAGCSTGPSTTAVSEAPTAPRAAASAHPPPGFPGAAGFVSAITNPYLSFSPGRTFRYESRTPNGVEVDVVEVTRQTKTIVGVVTTVVHDRVSLGGEVTEDTFDWYAQDHDGNVWYFGEDSKQLLNGVVVGTEGSWQAGVNGARPGIVMLGSPAVGVRYEQEFSAGVAEDMAKVTSLDASVTVPDGIFTGCLQTLEWSRLDPGVREDKFYAPGIGLVLETGRKGERVELIRIKGSRAARTGRRAWAASRRARAPPGRPDSPSRAPGRR